MSDKRIRNVSALEEALQSSFPKTEPQPYPTPLTHTDGPSSHPGTPTSSHPTISAYDGGIRVNSPAPSSKDRTSTYQSSSNQLLYNMCGLQTNTNTKLDILTDSILRLNKTAESMVEEQRKQTDILIRIMQNTAQPIRVPTEGGSSNAKQSMVSTRKCSDFGFTNVTNVLSEFILHILKQTEIQLKSHNKGYRSSRTMERVLLDNAIKVLANTDYKVGGDKRPKLDLPKTNSDSCVYLASKIGSTDKVKPIILPQNITQLFNDPACRTMIATVEEIMVRLKAIRWMIPYYEADMVNALNYPYFDDDGKVICNWGDLVPRSETNTEARIITAKTKTRETLGRLVITGIAFDKALTMTLKDD